MPPILDIARKYQKGSGTNEVPNGTFNFTEYWFRKDDYTQKEIGNKIGVSILGIAPKHQKDRVSKIDTDVSFNFTEYWFRTVGVEAK